MADEFRLLFSPMRVGKLILKNRIVFLPHLVQFAENHMPSEREACYYEERAKGGAGLTIYGSMTVQARSNLCRDCFAFDQRVIPGFKIIAGRVHKWGMHIFAQINHYGNQSLPGITLEDYDWLPVLAPSAVPDAVMGEIPKQMEEDDFVTIRQGYVSASGNIREAGLDGIEVNMGHASLLRQFLSPYSNMRKDEYGGTFENRLRYPIEVLKAVKMEMGENMPLGVRLCLDEFLPGGLNLEETKKIAQALEATHLIDFITADLGSYTSPHIMDPPMAVPLGYAVYASAALKESLDLPIIAFGRITDPYQAEKILQDGHADLIGMARQLICDPEFPNKAIKGQADDIRTCMGCNQGCFGRCWRNLSITCTQNPAAGREKVLGIGKLEPAAKSRKVLIVGGGPAGMKAAEVAARRGHKVILYETGEELGGNVLILMKSHNRDNFGECIRYLQKQIKKLPIEVVLRNEADEETIDSINPDVVVLACGATPQMPPVPGTNQPHVGTVIDLLLGKLKIGDNVIIYDTERYWTAANAAHLLLKEGAKVRLITPAPSLGMEIDYPSLFALNLDLFSKGLELMPNMKLREVGRDHVTITNIWSGKDTDLTGIDTVVMATGYKANDHLYQTIRTKFSKIYRIGDCLSPRRVDNAIWDGEQIARKI